MDVVQVMKDNIAKTFSGPIEKLDKVLGMHCNKGKCIACHFWFMTAMIYPDANLHPGWLVVDISSISLFVFWSNLRVSKAHTCTFQTFAHSRKRI